MYESSILDVFYHEFFNVFKKLMKYSNRKKIQNNLKQIDLLYGVERVVQRFNHLLIKE